MGPTKKSICSRPSKSRKLRWEREGGSGVDRKRVGEGANSVDGVKKEGKGERIHSFTSQILATRRGERPTI